VPGSASSGDRGRQGPARGAAALWSTPWPIYRARGGREEPRSRWSRKARAEAGEAARGRAASSSTESRPGEPLGFGGGARWRRLRENQDGASPAASGGAGVAGERRQGWGGEQRQGLERRAASGGAMVGLGKEEMKGIERRCFGSQRVYVTRLRLGCVCTVEFASDGSDRFQQGDPLEDASR
jgi:hypothetical protein